MKVQARLNRYRRSAQKVREIFPVIKGLDVQDAILQLQYSKRGDAMDIKKLLESAVANATNNFKLNKDSLFVENIIAEEGKTLKRWRARAYGRAAKILKRTCDIVITLEEKKEDKAEKKKVVKETTAKEEGKKEAKKEEKKEVKKAKKSVKKDK